jgi:periplasmic protein TonB
VEPFNQRQGFLVSAIVHLTFLMILISRVPGEKSKDEAQPPKEVARVFVPPAETLRQILPRNAMPRPRPAATPPPVAPEPPSPKTKDRISIGPPIPQRQKEPLILRKEDDLTKVAKGRPDAAPTPVPPAAPQPTPPPERAADAGSTLPKAPGREGLRLPPGVGQDLPRGSEGSRAKPGDQGPSIASSLRNFERRLDTSGPLGLPTGTGTQMGPLFFDPLGADFTVWINHWKNEVYRNWIMPQPAIMGTRGHVDIEFTVERDGRLSQCRILMSSGTPALDKAAKNALESGRFLPLPSDYGPKSVTMRASFFYNEGPGAS